MTCATLDVKDKLSESLAFKLKSKWEEADNYENIWTMVTTNAKALKDEAETWWIQQSVKMRREW